MSFIILAIFEEKLLSADYRTSDVEILIPNIAVDLLAVRYMDKFSHFKEHIMLVCSYIPNDTIVCIEEPLLVLAQFLAE